MPRLCCHSPCWKASSRLRHSSFGKVRVPGGRWRSSRGNRSQSVHARVDSVSARAAKICSKVKGMAARSLPRMNCGGVAKTKARFRSTPNKSIWSSACKALRMAASLAFWFALFDGELLGWEGGGSCDVVQLRRGGRLVAVFGGASELVFSVLLVLDDVAVLGLRGVGGFGALFPVAVAWRVGARVGRGGGAAVVGPLVAAIGWVGGFAGCAGSGSDGGRQRFAREAALPAKLSPRYVCKRASCAVAGMYPVLSVMWLRAQGRWTCVPGGNVAASDVKVLGMFASMVDSCPPA